MQKQGSLGSLHLCQSWIILFEEKTRQHSLDSLACPFSFRLKGYQLWSYQRQETKMGQFRLRPHWGSCPCTITLQSFLPSSKKQTGPPYYIIRFIEKKIVEKSCPSFPVQDGLSTGMLISTQVSFAGKTAKGNDVLAQYLICYMLALIWFSNTFYIFLHG